MEDFISSDRDALVYLGLEDGTTKASKMKEFMALLDNDDHLGLGRGVELHKSKIKEVIALSEGVVTSSKVHGVHGDVLLQQEVLLQVRSQALVNAVTNFRVYKTCIGQ